PGEALISLIGSASPPFLPPEPISAISGCMSAIEAGFVEMLEPVWVTISRLTCLCLPTGQEISRSLSQDRSPNKAMETFPKRNREATERGSSSPPADFSLLLSVLLQAAMVWPAPGSGLGT